MLVFGRFFLEPPEDEPAGGDSVGPAAGIAAPG